MSKYFLFQGEEKSFTIPLVLDGVNYEPPLGSSVVFTMKTSTELEDDQLGVVQKQLDYGLQIDDSGNASVTLVYEDTVELTPGVLFFDIKVQPLDSGPRIVASGTISLRAVVGRGLEVVRPIYTTSPPVPNQIPGPPGASTWDGIEDKPSTFPPTIGSGSGDAVAGNDSRLTNARTPTDHKSTHATGGSDALTPADIGAASETDLQTVAGVSAGAVASIAGIEEKLDHANGYPALNLSTNYTLLPSGLGKTIVLNGHQLTLPAAGWTEGDSIAITGTGTVVNGLNPAVTFDGSMVVVMRWTTASGWVVFSTSSAGVTSYNDLTDLPTLGSAAAVNADSFVPSLSSVVTIPASPASLTVTSSHNGKVLRTTAGYPGRLTLPAPSKGFRCRVDFSLDSLRIDFLGSRRPTLGDGNTTTTIHSSYGSFELEASDTTWYAKQVSPHMHLSIDIEDASLGGNGNSDENRVAKYGPMGRLQAAFFFAVDENGNTVVLDPFSLSFTNALDGGTFIKMSTTQTTEHDLYLPVLTENSTIALTSDLTGLVTTATIGSLIAGSSSKTTPVDADSIAISDSASSNILSRVTFANLKAWLQSWIDAITAIAGAKTFSGALSFTSTTRPTTSGTGSPDSTSMLSRVDVDDSELWAVGRLVRMTSTNAITSATGNASATNVHGQLQLYSGTNAGSGIGHYVWRPLWTVAGGTNGYRAANQACGFAFRGIAQFGASATHKHRIWFAFNSTANGINLADASEPVASTAIGMEFWLSGSTRKVRLFYRKDGSTATVFSSTYDLTYVADTDMDSFYFKSDGTNIYLYYLPSHVTNRRIPQTPVISWLSAISNAPAAGYLYLCASTTHPSASPTSAGSLILQSLVIDPP